MDIDKPRFSDNIFPFDISDIRIPAVLTVIAVIPEHKIFIIAQRNCIRRKPRVFDRCDIDLFRKLCSVYIDPSILDL